MSVLDEFEPAVSLMVKYEHEAVHLGNRLKKSQTQSAPEVQVISDQAEPDSGTYVVVITDPDALDKAEFAHWIIGNVPDGGPVTDGKQILEYKAPAPPEGSGDHRYVVVVLKGDKQPQAPKDRPNWGTGKKGSGVRGWAKENGLQVVGANYFICSYE